jgi:hypothetical protein
MLTYKELLERLQGCSQEQLEQNVSIYISDIDEYYPVENTRIETETDVLDEGHFVLVV